MLSLRIGKICLSSDMEDEEVDLDQYFSLRHVAEQEKCSRSSSSSSAGHYLMGVSGTRFAVDAASAHHMLCVGSLQFSPNRKVCT